MRTITVKELNERLEKGEKVNLLDVREPDEHDEFNIGGTLLPVGQIDETDAEEIESLKDKEIVVYCRSGHRSGIACVKLEALGFKNVTNLEGGMLAWQDFKKQEND